MVRNFEEALELLSEMVSQADQDCPADYRTKHFRSTMDDCVEFLIKSGKWEKND